MRPRVGHGVRRVVGALSFAAVSASWAEAAAADSRDQCVSDAERSQPLRDDGQLLEARQKLLACSRLQCPDLVRSDCITWLAEVNALLPSLVVHAVNSTGADVAGVRVSVDGKGPSPVGDGREIEIDPGEHTLRLEHDGDAPVEQHLVVRESERHRLMSVVFVAGPVAAPAGIDRPTARGHSDAVPIVMLGAGGVGLGLAAAFWLSGLGDRSSMASGCATTHSCSQSQIDSARDKLIVGDVAALAGFAAAAVGAGMLIFDKHDPVRDARVSVTPLLVGGAMLGVDGRF